MSDMTDLQRFLVADHIAQLDDEAAALRAERRRGVGDHDVGSGTPVRARVGRWLVVLGTAIAGPGPSDDGTSIPRAA